MPIIKRPQSSHSPGHPGREPSFGGGDNPSRDYRHMQRDPDDRREEAGGGGKRGGGGGAGGGSAGGGRGRSIGGTIALWFAGLFATIAVVGALIVGYALVVMGP